MGVLFPGTLLLQLGSREEMEEEKERDSNGSVWNEKMEAKGKGKVRRRNRSSFLMKKRRSSRPANGIERRLDRLRNLIPNLDINADDDEPVGLEQLFTDTADYILSLQRRVRLMQTFVNVLSGSDE